VPQPQQLDFVALRDGVIRNNVGVDRIVVALKARIDGGTVVADGTQQTWTVDDAPKDAAQGAWIWAEVRELDATPRLSWIGASRGPSDRPPALPVPGGSR